MKHLYLLRHAEAERGGGSMSDFDRALSARGRAEAALMGRYARSRAPELALVLCSPAARAKLTAALFLEAAGVAPPVVYDERIYEASAGRLLRVMREIAHEAEAALVVGHNPGMAELLALLTHEAAGMPTGALAAVALDVGEWRETQEGCGRLAWRATPGDEAER